jgi:hypothetical protein
MLDPEYWNAQFLAGNVAFYTWPSLGYPSAIGWREELVAVVGRPTTAVLRGKGRFAFVGCSHTSIEMQTR